MEPSTSIALVKHIKSLIQRDIKSLGDFHNNTPNALPSDYVTNLSLLISTHSSMLSSHRLSVSINPSVTFLRLSECKTS